MRIGSYASPHDQFDAAVTVNLQMGTTAVVMRRYPLIPDDCFALAAAIDSAIKQILAGWPRTAYASEIRKLVRATLCERREDLNLCL